MVSDEIKAQLVNRMVALVARSAALRGDLEVPPELIKRVFDLIEGEEIRVERLETGAPSPKAIYDLAFQLHQIQVKEKKELGEAIQKLIQLNPFVEEP